MTLPINLIKGFLDGLTPEEILTVSQWADKHRILSEESSSSPGRYRTDKVPYLREIMDNLSTHSNVIETTVMKGAQLGLSECGFNWIGYTIDHSPCTMLMVMPTEDTVRRNSKIRIDPMIMASPRLRQKVGDSRTRDSGNTHMSKSFPGGLLLMAGANSPAGLRSIPVAKLFLDEIDGYPVDLGGEGSVVDLAMARTRTFPKRKVFKISTPTIEGVSVIQKDFLDSDQRYYFVPCPHCAATQTLIFGQVKYTFGEDGKPQQAKYECIHCNELIEERFKNIMFKAGEWVPTKKQNVSSRKRGYHINSLYSPFGWYSWTDAAREFEDAKTDPAKMKTFTNTVLGETTKESSDRPEWEHLYNRSRGEKYKVGIVPLDVAFLTAGVDVQKDRLEMAVIGWCYGRRNYMIDYIVIGGDTDKPKVWVELAKKIATRYPREGENQSEMPILRTCVDTGYNTSYVYDFCKKYDQTQVVPIRGQGKQELMLASPKSVNIKSNGRAVGKLLLWNVGVSIIKSEIYGWLRLGLNDDGTEPDGYCHFGQFSQEYFKGLVGEEYRLTVNKKGYQEWGWVKVFDRNEPLDTFVYARAAASMVGIDRMKEKYFIDLVQSYEIIEKKPEIKKKKSDFWNK